jgi:dimeric dUTPase (all-alpha-NTP-PPase superfamily)
MRYFELHVRQEFSEENLLCWRAIEEFRSAPSLEKLRAIHVKYLMLNAPLQVNISHRELTIVNEQVMRSHPFPPPPFTKIFASVLGG